MISPCAESTVYLCNLIALFGSGAPRLFNVIPCQIFVVLDESRSHRPFKAQRYFSQENVSRLSISDRI